MRARAPRAFLRKTKVHYYYHLSDAGRAVIWAVYAACSDKVRVMAFSKGKNRHAIARPRRLLYCYIAMTIIMMVINNNAAVFAALTAMFRRMEPNHMLAYTTNFRLWKFQQCRHYYH
jgi:hypothetical protein